MRFSFATSDRILFGAGAIEEVGGLAASLGSRALVVTGRDPDRHPGLYAQLEGAGLVYTGFAVAGEPTVAVAEAGAEVARSFDSELVIAIGGGSALDAGKAISALLTNEGSPLDYLEGIGRGRPLECPAAPMIALPTTSGTGSEVTKNAVLKSTAHQVKVSLRHESMIPRYAVIDPALTLSLPPAVTADCGLDALTQVIEPYVSCLRNPLTDAICREGIRRAARSLRRAYVQGDDLEAREDMALASLFGGLALANAKLGAVHGFAGPLGGLTPAPHGAVCARLLPAVTEANVAALLERGGPDREELLERYREIATWLTGDPGASVADGVTWLRELARALKIKPLGRFGLREADLPIVIEKSARSSSMKGNPLPLTEGELEAILRAAM
jgi:alcohol dehydrogenase class IV